MGVEPSFAGRHRDAIGKRQAEEDLEVENAIHCAACTLERLLKSVHRPGDMFLKGIGNDNMIVIRIAVIGARTEEVVDPVVSVIVDTSGRTARGRAGRFGCLGRRNLLGKKFRRARYDSRHRRDLTKKPSSSIDLQDSYPFDILIRISRDQAEISGLPQKTCSGDDSRVGGTFGFLLRLKCFVDQRIVTRSVGSGHRQ
jgi:hypothetical protein